MADFIEISTDRVDVITVGGVTEEIITTVTDVITIDGVGLKGEKGIPGSSGVWGTITGDILNQTDLQNQFATKEDDLGLPASDGQVLSSLTGGARSWITLPAGAVDSVNGQTGVVVLDTDDIDDSIQVNKYVTASQIIVIDNTSGVNTGDQDIGGIATNAADIVLIEAEQITQNNDIQSNTDEIGTLLVGNYTLGLNVGQDLSLLDTQVKSNADAIGALPGTFVESFDGRTGAVLPILDDYQASLVTNDSTETGATVKDALDNLDLEQGTQDSAIALNTVKVGITPTQASDIATNNAKISFDSASSTRLANTSGTNTGDQDIGGIATNAADIVLIEAEQITQNADIATLQSTAIISASDSPNVTDSIWRGNQVSFDLITPVSGKLYYINNDLFAPNQTIITIDTTQAGSASDTFIFPLSSMGGLSSIWIDWGDGSGDVITATGQAELTHVYASSGIYDVISAGDVGYSLAFLNGGDKDKLIEVKNLGNFTMRSASFHGCINLVRISATDIPKDYAVSVFRCFAGCTSLIEVNNIENYTFAGATSAYSFFSGCISLSQDMKGINLPSNVNYSTFYSGASIIDFDLTLGDYTSANNMLNMLSNSGFSVENYSNFLIHLASNPPVNNTALGAVGLMYNAGAVASRDYLINTIGMTITDAGLEP